VCQGVLEVLRSVEKLQNNLKIPSIIRQRTQVMIRSESRQPSAGITDMA
jgi:hypothetical protein